MDNTKFITYSLLLATAVCLTVAATPMETATDCPFDETSCQKYCATQGCNLGYCGHFAWIQCICRKCGDEWNSYDKLRLNPSAQVNQTELDSLKLNGTSTSNSTGETTPTPTLVATTDLPQPEDAGPLEMLESSKQPATTSTQQESTLTLLLVPDLSSDNDNLDQNEIPDENSEKFLDYLVANHAKLVQATLARASQQSSSSSGAEDGSQPEEELIEIQLSSNNSSRQLALDEQQPKTTSAPPLQNLLRPETKATARTTSSGAE